MTGKPVNGATDAAPSPGAQRIARDRNRRRKGMRCITIELNESEIGTLVRRGWLARDNRAGIGPLPAPTPHR